MTRLETLERDVQSLTQQELAEFRAWFAEYDWQVWDRQLEQDVASGKLDAIAAEALAEYERGETTKL
jgi:trans-2-enoyl-CoA reductase